jgi:hypothetical protein
MVIYMNMLDLNDFRKITWPFGHFEQPFWEFNIGNWEF